MSAAKSAGTSYAACNEGEAVSGGGFELLEQISPKASYVLQANRPSLIETATEEEGEGTTTYPAPKDGAAASGWAVTIEDSFDPELGFRAYVMCAVPASGKEQSILQQANSGQELQQVLELLH